MTLSEQNVYLGMTRYKRTVWSTYRRKSDGRLMGSVRFKGMSRQTVGYVGDETDLQLQETRGNRGYWEVVYE